MGLRTVDLERDLTKLLDRAEFENVRTSSDYDLAQRVRACLEEWKRERDGKTE